MEKIKIKENYETFKFNDFNINKNTLEIPSKIYDKTYNSKILLIRHGQTDYNIKSKTLGKKIRSLPEFINAPLNEKGKKQAKEASKNFINFDIETVYCSPLKRSLETATILFENHPKKNEFRVIIHPYLVETVAGVHSFLTDSDIKNEKELYNMNSNLKFDWSLFDYIYKSEFEQTTFYINYIDVLKEDKIKTINNNLKIKFKTPDFISELSNLGQLINDLGLFRIESLKHLWSRVIKFKEFLKEFHKNTLDDLNKKVIVVGHSAYGKVLTSSKIYKLEKINDFPSDCYQLKNCDIISLYL